MRKEISVFVIVGILTVLIDFSVYQLLIWATNWGTHESKGAGFLAGTLFSYLTNRLWTFGATNSDHSSIWKFITLYGATLTINIGTNGLIIAVLTNINHHKLVAFILATGLSAFINFLGMKFYVFRKR